MKIKILQIALPKPLATHFDYLPPEGVEPDTIPVGVRVRVPFGKATSIGFVVGHALSAVPLNRLKAIEEVIDSTPLFPEKGWLFLNKAYQYYHHPLGEVLITGLPVALRQGKPILDGELSSTSKVLGKNSPDAPKLTESQTVALQSIKKSDNTFTPFLLKGVTGSGKTEVYLQALADCYARGKSALVLIPEISLTPQTIERFEKRLQGDILLYHSQVTPKARLGVWSHVRRHSPVTVVGTRSALFLPFNDLGLIIVDEEHDASFKQQEGFHYSARDLAVLRAHLEQCPILLGSATPSFESLHNVTLNKYTLLELPERVNQALLPKIEIQDVRHKKLNGGLSAQMIDKIQKHLNDGQQVLIFLNRRGYAPTWMCYECAHTASCLQCDAKLIYHHSKKKLLCHHCHRIYPLQETCSQCQAPMNAVGIGTEKLEETLAELFPNTPPLRIDSDTTRKKGMLTEKLGLIHEGSAQLLIGTQLLAKGHHFPNLTLVAIVDVDGGLFSSDFRAVEKMGQLITQVAGRSGRAEKPGEVVLQTCHPQHPLVQALIEKGYDAFATELLKERQQTFLPPFSHLAIIRAQAKTAQAPEQFLEKLKKMLDQISSEVSVFGPNIAIMAKKQGYHRFQLTLQASSRNQLHGLLAKLTELIQKVPERTRVRWSLDVDPIEMS